MFVRMFFVKMPVVRWFSPFYFAAIGCGPAVRMQVLVPADLSVPTHIQTVAVVDRSRAKNVGQAVLGVLEGALTGEEIGADTSGRTEALGAVRSLLMASPRFDVVTPNIDKKGLDSSLFDKQMSWDTAKRICKQVGCEGIVALEAFDSDTSVDIDVDEYTEEKNGKQVTRKSYTAERWLKVLTAWRLYDVSNGGVVDDKRDLSFDTSWSSTGETEDAARQGLQSQSPYISQMGRRSGEAYAARIAPVYTWVMRRLYKSGSDKMKVAAKLTRSDRWDKATAIWKKLSKSKSSAKVRARALHNLAIFHERSGDLSAAVDAAQAAVNAGGKARSVRYVGILRSRQSDALRLEQQLSKPTE
jgi:hypothetical protein